MPNAKKKSVKATVGYVVSGIVFSIAAASAISKGIPYMSGLISKASAKRINANADDNNWGPVIEKKNADLPVEEPQNDD